MLFRLRFATIGPESSSRYFSGILHRSVTRADMPRIRSLIGMSNRMSLVVMMGWQIGSSIRVPSFGRFRQFTGQDSQIESLVGQLASRPFGKTAMDESVFVVILLGQNLGMGG
jgi:hypothetical protein